MDMKLTNILSLGIKLYIIFPFQASNCIPTVLSCCHSFMGGYNMQCSYCVCVCVCVLLSHVWLCNPVDCSLPGSSVHGIPQARVLEWVSMPFSQGSYPPRIQTQVSHTAGRCFTIWATQAMFILVVLKGKGDYLWPLSSKCIAGNGEKITLYT